MTRGAWAVTAVLVVLVGCRNQPPGPIAGDRNSRSAHDAIVRYADGLAGITEGIAEKLDAGESLDAGRTRDEIADATNGKTVNGKKTKGIREKAFLDVDKALDKAIKAGKFDPEDARLFRSLTIGYRSVAKGSSIAIEYSGVEFLLQMFGCVCAVWLTGAAIATLRRRMGFCDGQGWPRRFVVGLLSSKTQPPAPPIQQPAPVPSPTPAPPTPPATK